MRVLRRGGHARTLVLLSAVLVPTAVGAQPGFYITPSFSVAEVYDDNVFVTADRRESDFISRLSPSIEAGYQSAPLTLLGRYSFDAEIFAEHRELSTAQARQQAGAEARYLPTPSLTLALKGDYITTQTAAELNTLTGLETGRVPARRLLLGPSIVYGFDPLTTGTVDYTFTRDNPSGGIQTDVHVGSLGLDRRLTARDTASLGYTLRQFAFEGDGTSTSHVFTVGWKHDFTASTSVAVRAGPNFTDGSVEPEVSASIRHRLRRGELIFAYERTQATAIGLPGVVESEGFTGTFTYQLLSALQVRAMAGFSTSTRASLEAKVYRAEVEATYQITRWLALVAAYHFAFQQQSLDPAAPRSEEIRHNIFTLRLAASYPYRVR